MNGSNFRISFLTVLIKPFKIEPQVAGCFGGRKYLMPQLPLVEALKLL